MCQAILCPGQSQFKGLSGTKKSKIRSASDEHWLVPSLNFLGGSAFMYLHLPPMSSVEPTAPPLLAGPRRPIS